MVGDPKEEEVGDLEDQEEEQVVGDPEEEAEVVVVEFASVITKTQIPLIFLIIINKYNG